MRRYTLFAALVAMAGMPLRVPAQSLSLGLIGGGSLTDAVQTETLYNIRTWSPSEDWIAGATFELHFRSSFSVEVDGMYREPHATEAFVEPNGTLNSVSPARVVTWEFPVLAKYRFGAGKLKPFLEAGPSFRATGNLNFQPSHHGVTAGFGVETNWRGWEISPALRYTRWAPDAFQFMPASQLNQVELLVGVSRTPESHWSPLGQRISVGAIGGWGLTNDVTSSSNNLVELASGPGGTYTEVNGTSTVTGLKSFIIGAALEVHLPRHLSVELDALYKPLRGRFETVLDNGTMYGPETGTEAATWQFPVLAKYRLRLGRLNPFVEAGPSFRLPEESLSTYGIAAGAGVEMHWHALHIAPALRFTHWAAGNSFQSAGFTQNEAAILLGVSLGGPPLGTR
jgi:hypothetical protein